MKGNTFGLGLTTLLSRISDPTLKYNIFFTDYRFAVHCSQTLIGNGGKDGAEVSLTQHIDLDKCPPHHLCKKINSFSDLYQTIFVLFFHRKLQFLNFLL